MPNAVEHCTEGKQHSGRRYSCAVELALNVIGGKWKPLAIYRLGTQGTLRFGELRRQLPGASQKMLTQQLRELEADGLVLRTAHASVPPRVEYSLTERGRSVMPILGMLCQWGAAFERELALKSGPDGAAEAAPHAPELAAYSG